MSALLQKIVLGEIEGKNRAIHAYDDIVWKIRTGFLTLILGGWAIVLKGIVDAQSPDMERYRGLVSALLLFSVGFTFGAWYIDRSYLRGKFRVILALNALIDELATSGKELNTLSSLLKVVGDDAQREFDCAGYREAMRTELAVYLVPLIIILITGVFLIVSTPRREQYNFKQSYFATPEARSNVRLTLLSGQALCQEPPPPELRRSRYRSRCGGGPSG
jgi:hypothetical protein